MPSFSKSSRFQLLTCDIRLQKLFNQVVLFHDCTVIEGHRQAERQIKLFNEDRSKVRKGKHNFSPSQAVDVAPWLPARGIPWPQPDTKTYTKDVNQFYYFAGVVLSVADSLDIQIRWGGDWDRDHNLLNNHFDDLVHFELLN